MNLIRRFIASVRPPNGHKLLADLAHGSTLKSHRDLEGVKKYVLHHLDDTQELIDDAIVAHLKQQQMIDSNKKFPAETYILTQHGHTIATELIHAEPQPLSSRNF